MSELTDRFKTEFQDGETRHIYAEDFLNTFIATQLKVLREDREWTQQVLAERAGMRQERISVLEDVNYESWSVKTLKRLAKAFDLRLSIKFESFGSFLKEYEKFHRDALKRPSFGDDPAFQERVAATAIQGDRTVSSIKDFLEFKGNAEKSESKEMSLKTLAQTGKQNYGTSGR
jgi:transcriptional regulator with XRE-family HTH domain